MHVVILVNELLRGGAQRIILDLVKNIDHERYKITVVYLKSHSNFTDMKTIEDEIRGVGVEVVSLEGGKRFRFGDAWRLYRMLRRLQPDILHTFLPYAGIFGRVIGRLAGVTCTASTQCNLPVAYTRHLYLLDRATLFLADAWVGATESIESRYGGSTATYTQASWIAGRRHFTVVAGVDLPTFDRRVMHADREAIRATLGLVWHDVLVVMVARMVSWKGHADLIAALVLLPAHVHLGLVGWGPLEGVLKEQAFNAGVAARVHFLGVRSDVPELLAAADIYAQTHGHAPDGSIWMGPNTSQMEACAARVPSVSTHVPAIEYLIEDEVTGKIAQPNNPQSIAAAITYLLEHPEDAAAYVVRARKRVESRYSVAGMVHAYESLYTALRAT